MVSFNTKAETFLYSVEDVPLPNGYEEDVSNALKFDKPGGRIIETIAIKDGVSENDNNVRIMSFYEATLPSLGWKKNHGNAQAIFFEKDHENLKINSKQMDNISIIYFALKPKEN